MDTRTSAGAPRAGSHQCPPWIAHALACSLLSFLKTYRIGREFRVVTYVCPWNTRWDSSIIFHTRTLPSLPPDDTALSCAKQSMDVTLSSWPNLIRKQFKLLQSDITKHPSRCWTRKSYNQQICCNTTIPSCWPNVRSCPGYNEAPAT